MSSHRAESDWTLLRRYLGPQRAGVVGLSVLLVGSSILQVLYPQILRWFIDGATAAVPLEQLVRIALLFLAVAITQQCLLVGASAVGERVAWTATNALREDLALHCLQLDLTFHKARTPGELIERVDGDVALLSSFFSQFAILVVGNALFLMGVLFLLFREDWRFGLAFTAFVAIGLTAQLKLRQVAVVRLERVRATNATYFGRLGEWLSGTEDIRSLGAVNWVLHGYERMLPEWMHQYVNAALWSSTTAMASIALFGVGSALALGVGATMFWAGAISVGTVFLLYQYTEQIRQPLDRLRTLIDDFQKAGAGLIRVRALLAMSSRLPDTGTARLPAGALAVELDDVSFTYADDDSNTAVLHDVSFRLAPGRMLGLLGRTGSGKTTIARLLVRLYDAEQGCIRIAERPVADISLSSLRTHVRLVTQDVQLFRTTLRDNLTLFDGSIPDPAIWTALEEVGLAEWAAAFEQQLDTSLDADALSAGEAQLLALARVFLANPGLIILDEASARLDPATERRIRHAVDRLLRDRSGIIIAHRLATVRHVDDIAVLEDGRLVEFGERAALEQDSGSRFARLLQSGGLVELLA